MHKSFCKLGPFHIKEKFSKKFIKFAQFKRFYKIRQYQKLVLRFIVKLFLSLYFLKSLLYKGRRNLHKNFFHKEPPPPLLLESAVHNKVLHITYCVYDSLVPIRGWGWKNRQSLNRGGGGGGWKITLKLKDLLFNCFFFFIFVDKKWLYILKTCVGLKFLQNLIPRGVGIRISWQEKFSKFNWQGEVGRHLLGTKEYLTLT